MSREGKTIFSRRFPQPDFDGMYEEAEKELQALKKTNQLQSCIDYLRELEGRCVYVPNEDKLNGLSGFLDRARQLSLDYKIDMDIQQFDYSVMVTLYLYYRMYEGAAKDHFAELLKQCDDISFYRNFRPPFDLALFLSYRTHECRISERQAT